jgi:two-component system, cell cycle sensor histidine kinase and response regulator CckA
VLQRTLGEDCPVSLLLEPALGPVRADPGQLEQVLLNLAINARDAMPRGGRLTLETATVELNEGSPLRTGVRVRPGRYAQVAVSDSGHGMDQATLAHAFEPFFTTKGVGQGTGLGLATVYGIIKQSDGYVWAESQPGHGTTIKIYLPMTAPAPEAAPVTRSVSPRASGELVLVVEDEEQVRTVAARALTEAGYRVLVAESGARALEIVSLNGNRPALALVDVVMPGISGSELAAELARTMPGTRVLFTSGYTDGEILRRGLLEPGAAFLAKPFSPEALVRAVHDALATQL